MKGEVDQNGRALLTVFIRPLSTAPSSPVEVWIDTGFNGDLVLPKKQIEDLSLVQSATVKAILADGSEVVLATYSCFIEWFGEIRQLEVVGNDGEYPLLGVGLLVNRDLFISYKSGEIGLD